MLCLLLGGCATPQCVQRDYTQPMLVTIPVSGMLVTRTVYPCLREE